MFENIELRRVANGFVVTVTTEDDSKEYIFENQRRVFKFLKEMVEAGDSNRRISSGISVPK